MNHCVGRGGYSRKCRNEESHIISLRKAGKPIATMELVLSQDGDLVDVYGKKWKKEQLFGENNSEVSDEIRETADIFLSKIRTKEIELKKTGATNKTNILLKGVPAVCKATGIFEDGTAFEPVEYYAKTFSIRDKEKEHIYFLPEELLNKIT